MVKSSVLTTVRTANARNKSAQFTEFFVSKNELIDEVDLL